MSTTLTTDWFRVDYFHIDWWTPREVGIHCYTRNPVFTEASAAVFDGVTSAADLATRPEWVPIHSSVASTVEGEAASLYLYQFDNGTGIKGLQLVNVDAASANVDTPLASSGWTFTASDPDASVQELVTSVAFYLVDPSGSLYGRGVDPIMFVTTQGLGEETIIHEGAILGQFHLTEVTGGNARVLTVDDSALPPTFTATHVILLPASPTWEGAHTQHLWLEPQRTNFIANPSFEDASLYGWRWSPPSA